MKCFILILSDVHLAPPFESAQLPFRSEAFSPATHLAQTIDRAVEAARANGAHLEIVLNGDVFDFDVPQSLAEADSATRLQDVRTEDAAARALSRTIAAHLPFFFALRRALAAGAQVIVLPGNHDAQLVFPAVQSTLRAVLGDRVTFKPWFHLAGGSKVLVEHGHQYDPLCVVSRLLPKPGERAESTVGTVSSFYAPLLVPGADPFAIDPFLGRRSLRSMASEAASRGGPFLACISELLAAGANREPPDNVADLGLACGFTTQLIDHRRGFFVPKATFGQVYAACTGTFDYGNAVEKAIQRAMTAALHVHNAEIAVVGHTHNAGAITLPSGATLLNSGSWTPRRSSADPIGSYAWIAVDGGRVVDASVNQVGRA